MAKSSKKQKPSLPDNSRVILDQVVTAEARQHGAYDIGKITITEGEFGANQKGTQSVIRNYACDTIKRWETDGSLDARQVAAVDIYRRAHAITFGSPSSGQNWDRFLTGVGSARNQHWADNSAEARDDLDRIEKLLKKGPPYVLDTWVSVTIHDLGAGPAGEFLNHKDVKARRAAALTIIRLCCDLIATEWRL